MSLIAPKSLFICENGNVFLVPCPEDYCIRIIWEGGGAGGKESFSREDYQRGRDLVKRASKETEWSFY